MTAGWMVAEDGTSFVQVQVKGEPDAPPPVDTGEDLDDVDDYEPERIHVGFKVVDLKTADWAAEQLAAARSRFIEYSTFVKAEMETLASRLADQRRRLERDEAFFGGHLEVFHRLRVERDPKAGKSLALPHGTLKLTAGREVVEVADVDAFVCAHGFESPFVRPRPEPDKAAIKRSLDAGQPVAGAELVRRPDTFKVETGEALR